MTEWNFTMSHRNLISDTKFQDLLHYEESSEKLRQAGFLLLLEPY